MSQPVWPSLTVEDLRQAYVGKHIYDLPKPSLILDRSIMQRHCRSLRDAVDSLGVGFRAHIKTHKTREGTGLQAGTAKDVRLVASTVAEMEHILPLLQEYQRQARNVNVLYGIPLPASQVDRLAVVSSQLGPRGLSVLVDHASQLSHLQRLFHQTEIPVGVYLKVDTGYHRAGLPPRGINKDGLVTKLLELETKGQISFTGVYSHSSLSYNDSTPTKAMAHLESEINGCLEALAENTSLFPSGKELTISVGASPQVTAVENTLEPGGALTEDIKHLRQTIDKATSSVDTLCLNLELHAGVYSVLDIQQLSTHSRTRLGNFEQEIAVSVVAEVCSVYNDGERQEPEALLALGTLGLGREPCVAYEGWGVLDQGESLTRDGQRLIVKRISQEHCIVGWGETFGDKRPRSANPIPLEVGQSVRIFPNHACVTGSLYSWYCVVDSAVDGQKVVDIWPRASPR